MKAYLNETNELFCLNPKTGSTSVKFLLHKILNKNSSNYLTGGKPKSEKIKSSNKKISDELHAKIDPLLISKFGQQGWNFEEDLGDKVDSLEETLFTREPFTRKVSIKENLFNKCMLLLPFSSDYFIKND